MNKNDDGLFHYDLFVYPFCIRSNDCEYFDENKIEDIVKLQQKGQWLTSGLNNDEISVLLVILRHSDLLGVNLQKYKRLDDLIGIFISEFSNTFKIDEHLCFKLIRSETFPITFARDVFKKPFKSRMKAILKRENRNYNGYTKDLNILMDRLYINISMIVSSTVNTPKTYI